MIMKTVIRFITFLFFLLSNAQTISASENYYIVYRGYHFINEDDDLIKSKIAIQNSETMQSRAAKALEEKGVTLLDARQKIMSLKNSSCTGAPDKTTPSFFHYFIEKYVNNYTGFNADVQNSQSAFRKILDQLGVNIDCNFLLSTSLHPTHAFRYASGEKLYGEHQYLRKLPQYDSQLRPKNQYIGYVDVLVIPAHEIEETGAFFVVEEFAKYHIKLCHHWSKFLPAEEEITFPLFIQGKYHKIRIPVQSPDFSVAYSTNCGLKQRAFNVFKEQLSQSIDNPLTRKEIENKISTQLSSSLAVLWNEKIKQYLRSHQWTPLFTSPSMQPHFDTLVPTQAVAIRKEVCNWINLFGRVGRVNNEININFDNFKTEFNFFNSHALSVLGRYGYPINIQASYFFEKGFEFLPVFLEAPNLTNLHLVGQDYTSGASAAFEWAGDLNAKYGTARGNYNFQPGGWREAGIGYDRFLNALRKRKQPLTLDITGQSLEPEYYDQLAQIPLLELIDDHRDDDEHEAELFEERISVLVDYDSDEYDHMDDEPDEPDYMEDEPDEYDHMEIEEEE